MKSNASHNTVQQRVLTAGRLAWLLLAGLFASCSSLIDEDLSDCLFGTGIRFEYLIYDDNGGAADAFATSVDRVTLHIFDGKGNHVATRSEAGDALRNPKWRMQLDLEPGSYHVIAWAGLDGVSFREPQSCSVKEDACVELKCDGKTSHDELHPLWHGAADIVVGNDYTEHKVSLIKDTRRIRVVLQQINGDPVHVKHFDFAITDDNSLLGHDNLPIPNGGVTYTPFGSGEESVGGSDDTGATTVAYADLSTSRLVASATPRLRIDRTSDHTPIIDIPLMDYLMLYRSEANKNRLTEQQFLDREDAYTLVFFLDRNLSWLKTQIIINNWTIHLDSIEW